ncbi:TetR family transcriptional regulator [Intrasporangium oryzae NRRL B-24470]|uniref:TetR family transcriptional regulator n=1 Tax=Intrasporangium oryzae NRRL B-24470 TaxID=1386089 RepID=W9G3Z1_9MICO|nr:TetR family transcriptional regulator [Intrasporangium oryzae]EWT00740.1 TetR family transcriptional regulator [Intrasporangium oryzae NRRL B-24470]
MALSREQVVGTAVDILRRYGLADLSMRRLARELDVQPGALYWHVASKQELLVEVADALLARIEEPHPERPPAESLASLASAIREAVLQVPDGAEVVALAYAVEPGSVRPLRDVVRLVGRLGVAPAERDAVAELVVHHVLGSVGIEHDRRRAEAAEPDVSPPSPAEAAKAFEVGIGVILRGIERPS